MKRNLLLLAVMVAMVFGFYSLSPAQCPEDPNDLGECDTLILETFCGDTALFTQGVETKMRIPIFVVHDENDQPNGEPDSIAAFVVPLCYTSSNPAANAYLPDTSNKTILHPFPKLWQSAFRHLDCGGDITTNWMMALAENENLEEWDTRIINLVGEGPQTQVFWMSLFPTGQEDQRFGDTQGERVLLATVTFHIQDSTVICVDSCFWPPNSRLGFTRADAASYIPRHNLPLCHEYFIVPNIPPEFTDTVEDQSHSQNDHYSTDDFTVYDQDGTIASVVASPTSLPGVANIAVVWPREEEKTGHVEYDVVDHCLAGGTVTLTVTDNQGADDTDEFTISLTNDPPTINAGGDKTGPYNVQLCSDAIVTGDANGDDVTWDILSVAPAPVGTFSKVGNAVCFDADCADVSITYTVTVEAEDECGATATDDVTFHVTNTAPTVAILDAPTTMIINDTKLIHFTYDDPEGVGTVTVDASADCGTVSGLTYADGSGSFNYTSPGVAGFCVVTVGVEDECGLGGSDDATIEIVETAYPANYVGIGYLQGEDCVEPGEWVDLPIIIANTEFGIGGFELEIEFDYTAMTFIGADMGDALTSLYHVGPSPFGDTTYSWEQFTYRLLPCPLCPCCKYKILLFGMHDLPNGPLNVGVPVPATTGDAELAVLHFVVNNDQNLRGYMIPVCWEWEGPFLVDNEWVDPDCGENTLSDPTGNILYTSALECQFRLDACDDPGFQAVEQVLVFQSDDCGQVCGGILVCPGGGEECKRGDVNYNNVAYEPADAVLFASYFVNGTDVFVSDDPEYQICASDVNADGRPLMLSDLIYLIRVILHDAVEIPKLAPFSEVAKVFVYNGTITTECAAPIAAMLFEFDGAVQPTLLANMEMVNSGNKVLVWSRNGHTFTTAEVLSFTGAQLVSVSAVDYNTRELKTTITAKAAPTAFALNPAYPNPFNPYVNLSFTLPEAMSYSLRIYNVAGQLVRSYEGVGSASLNVVTWDGKDNAAVEVSSGVYFYKLIAGGFSATQKMVMMK